MLPLHVVTTPSSNVPLSLNEIDLDRFDTEWKLPPTKMPPSSHTSLTVSTSTISLPTISSENVKNIAPQIVVCETGQTDTPAQVEAGVHTNAIRRSSQGSRTPCLSELILPLEFQMPLVDRMLISQPELCDRELLLKASITVGLPDARIWGLKPMQEAIAYGSCQILWLSW
jgi:hypothetical protein